MAIKYYRYQNKNSKNLKAYGKWYGRVVYDQTIGIEKIADQMQENCTVKRADILALAVTRTSSRSLKNSLCLKKKRAGNLSILSSFLVTG